jgi:hypothetical protein
MDDPWLWPVKARLIALGYLVLLGGGLAAIYVLACVLAPFF